MVQDIWKAAAMMVAAHIRTHHHDFQRGLLLIPRTQDDSVIIWIFGNDPDDGPEEIDTELELLRERIRDKALQELGCGYSADHNTWVMVLRSEDIPYQTAPGKAFHLEMLKASLDEAVQEAWQVTHAEERDAGMVLSKCQPTG
ncbi:MAG TPA: hypothetical protein VFA18_22355 [Gemmataceae bacterium]|nr:hypothetical protein [Gemmataceae bacterium]